MLPRRNILIFHQAALGDFVTTWPLAMALGRVFAQSRVIYVTGADKGRLAEDVIGVEYRSADDGWHALHGEVEPNDLVVRTLRSTQCAVLFADGDEAAFVGNLAKYIGDVPLIRLQPKPPAGVDVYTHHAQQLAGHGRLAGYVEQMQSLVRTNGLGRGVKGDGVLIHPGSGSPMKNWSIQSYVAIAERLRAAGRPVRFVIGEVERERWPASELKALSNAAEVVSPDDLVALRRLLGAAGVFIGNDSGPAHLAAALGLKTLTLFGPHSDVAAWKPHGPLVRTFAFETTVDDLAAAVDAD